MLFVLFPSSSRYTSPDLPSLHVSVLIEATESSQNWIEFLTSYVIGHLIIFSTVQISARSILEGDIYRLGRPQVSSKMHSCRYCNAGHQNIQLFFTLVDFLYSYLSFKSICNNVDLINFKSLKETRQPADSSVLMVSMLRCRKKNEEF